MREDSEDAFMLVEESKRGERTRTYQIVERGEFDAFRRQMIEGLELIADVLDNIIHALSDRA